MLYVNVVCKMEFLRSLWSSYSIQAYCAEAKPASAHLFSPAHCGPWRTDNFS